MEAEHQEPGLPPLMQELFEVAARRLGMIRGRQTLELRFENGRLRDWYRHDGPVAPGALRRFEEPASDS